MLIAALAVVFALGGAGMLALIGVQSGVTATVLGLALSLVVIGIVVPVFLWLDRFEAEPVPLLVFCFLWGACVATIGSAVLNDIGGYLLGTTEENNPLVATTVAPVVEESLKGLAPLLLLIFRRREIDGILDGMVYAGLSAAGFAFVEDIVYLANGYAEHGREGLVGTFILRVLMSPFAHPMFTICFGIGIGIAATTTKPLLRWVAPVLGWLCAVGLHAAWNAAAVLSDDGWLLLYGLVHLPFFVLFVVLLVWARRREAKTIQHQLGYYVPSGMLTPAEVAMLGSMSERRFARSWAQQHGGGESRRQMREFQDAASELAMLRARMNRTPPGPREFADEHELLTTMHHRRGRFLGTGVYRRFEVLGHL